MTSHALAPVTPLRWFVVATGAPMDSLLCEPCFDRANVNGWMALTASDLQAMRDSEDRTTTDPLRCDGCGRACEDTPTFAPGWREDGGKTIIPVTLPTTTATIELESSLGGYELLCGSAAVVRAAHDIGDDKARDIAADFACQWSADAECFSRHQQAQAGEVEGWDTVALALVQCVTAVCWYAAGQRDETDRLRRLVLALPDSADKTTLLGRL